MSTTTERLVRCHYLTTHPRRGTNQCTAECVDSEGEIKLCSRHLAAALALLQRRMSSEATPSAADGQP